MVWIQSIEPRLIWVRTSLFFLKSLRCSSQQLHTVLCISNAIKRWISSYHYLITVLVFKSHLQENSMMNCNFVLKSELLNEFVAYWGGVKFPSVWMQFPLCGSSCRLRNIFIKLKNNSEHLFPAIRAELPTRLTCEHLNEGNENRNLMCVMQHNTVTEAVRPHQEMWQLLLYL